MLPTFVASIKKVPCVLPITDVKDIPSSLQNSLALETLVEVVGIYEVYWTVEKGSE
jgi:hypothetical protein